MEDNIRKLTYDPWKVSYGCIAQPPIPYSTLIWEYRNGFRTEIGVDRKFNWFQRFMLKFCFGFKVRRNK